jgi:hypothetical protein
MASNPDQLNQTSNITMVRMAPYFSCNKKHIGMGLRYFIGTFGEFSEM